MIFILPCIDKWDRVDMRVKAFNVPPQKVIETFGLSIYVSVTKATARAVRGS